MQNQSNDAGKSFTSVISIVVMGIALVFLMEYFGKGDDKKKPTGQGTEAVQQSAPDESMSSVEVNDYKFFTGEEKFYEIDTDTFHVVLSSKGARVDRFYLKGSDELRLPDQVVKNSGDEKAIKFNALEVTRKNGMDFQFHANYEKNDQPWQIANPTLNQASFTVEGPFQDEQRGVQEIRFRTRIEFKGHKLELIKLYRFLEGENYFHQVSVLRNLESGEFKQGGDLFFKPFGDIGPAPGKNDDNRILASYGRFTYYNGESSHFRNVETKRGGASGCSFIHCGDNKKGSMTVMSDGPNSLETMGTTSRYFIGYTGFITGDAPDLQKPDGLVVVNEIDPTGKDSFSSFYRKPVLEAALPEEPALGSVNGVSNGEILKKTKKRKDALVVDNMVYYGLRRDESHNFHNEKLVQSEFGVQEPNSSARDVIYSNWFLALFAGIRDVIIWLMRFLYIYIGNYGWVIILIAGTFKLSTWPLNQIQAKSMKRMHALKPEMEKINEKYKDNPQEKQKRTVELYKQHNVNPAKGCLPVIIQIPIFIALYSAFSESVELWKSPFIFWMKDLSAPDTLLTINWLFIQDFHLNILPLFMVGSQLLQQMTTTVVADNQQKKLMYLMPIVMIFFFWNMPSGVTLYWTIQNLITVLWQVVVERFSKDEEKKA